ncbi:MAG: Grx4 family monothiol glutaredoxin [Acidiferrobacteraceae bacterium]
MAVDVNEKIRQQIGAHDIVLYMKGTPQFPQCGFSGKSVQILKACGVQFQSVDVLADPEIREGIKRYSNWPTVPQLYVRGEFIGGCDIMTELYQKGELQRIVAGVPAK